MWVLYTAGTAGSYLQVAIRHVRVLWSVATLVYLQYSPYPRTDWVRAWSWCCRGCAPRCGPGSGSISAAGRSLPRGPRTPSRASSSTSATLRWASSPRKGRADTEWMPPQTLQPLLASFSLPIATSRVDATPVDGQEGNYCIITCYSLLCKYALHQYKKICAAHVMTAVPRARKTLSAASTIACIAWKQ